MAAGGFFRPAKDLRQRGVDKAGGAVRTLQGFVKNITKVGDPAHLGL
jgi:hypothetical protein